MRALGSTLNQSCPGGGEVQSTETVSALRELGIDARHYREKFDKFREIDVLHIFGSLREHLSTAIHARRRGIAVVVSPIAWFDAVSRWKEGGNWTKRIVRQGRFALSGAIPWVPNWRKRLYRTAHALLPNSEAERDQLMRRFRIPQAAIHVVPNGASSRFAEADPFGFASQVGGPGYVLIPGRIEPRKNQRAVLQALHGSGLRQVVLGDTVPGHENYAAACRDAADANVTFVPRIPHDDPLLASAYAGCGCLALLSWFETPGLVALEAGMSGVPLALTNRGCAREYFGNFASYANPADVASVRAAVKAALSRPRDAALATHIRENFTWRQVAEATLAAYEQALWNSAQSHECAQGAAA